MTILDAEGSWVWDGEGRPMVDFSGQLVFTNVGHRHPKIVAAIREQAETLRAAAQGALARYKQPREYIRLDALPRTPTGKINRRALRERHRKDR